MVEERSRVVFFFDCYRPVVEQELSLVGEIENLQTVVEETIKKCKNPSTLPLIAEDAINNYKAPDQCTLPKSEASVSSSSFWFFELTPVSHWLVFEWKWSKNYLSRPCVCNAWQDMPLINTSYQNLQLYAGLSFDQSYDRLRPIEVFWEIHNWVCISFRS